LRTTACVVMLALPGLMSGCGGSGGTASTTRHSAQEPAIVAAAERAVHDRVTSRLDASRASYPDDAQVFPEGDASCKPLSNFQLDCTQKIRDETNPWTGTTSWRATVDQATGNVTVIEHGGRPLSSQLDQRSTCLAAGVDCG